MNKCIYYIIQWTWGIVMNILGVVVSGIVIISDLIYWIIKRRHCCHFYKYRNAVCIVIPWNFGGLELGMFFMRGKYNESLCTHEYGHSIQNLWWGPLFPLIIGLPSAIRYWWRIFYRKIIYPHRRKKLPPYDAIWFEGQATKLGEQAENNKWTWL